MPAPTTTDEFLELVRKSGLVEDAALNAYLHQAGVLPQVPAEAAAQLYLAGLITPWQGGRLLQGKYRGFHIGKYKVLDRLAETDAGPVFLGERQRRETRPSWSVGPWASNIGGVLNIPQWISRSLLPLTNEPRLLEGLYRDAGGGVLDHPNVVRLYDLDSDENLHFLVMQRLEGTPLSRVLLDADGHLPVGEACGCAVQVATGLHAAHNAGLIHRHIRPSNLFVWESGLVKIFGLGLHRAFDATLKESQDKSLWDYSAPEQALDGPVDCRTDIYSLGVTLYRLVTSLLPVRLEPRHTTIRYAPAHKVRSDVPDAISPIIAKMMEKYPQKRYQSMAEVIAALRPFVVPDTTAKYPPMAEAALGTC